MEPDTETHGNPITGAFKGLSKTQKRLVAGGGVLVIGYMAYSHHKSTGSWNIFSGSTATAATGTATGIDPVTGLPYSKDTAIDPLTGMTYLGEAQQYGSVSAAESAVSSYGSSADSGIPVNPGAPISQGSMNTVTGTTLYTSNSAWAQAATAGLADVGYNETEVATALGAYLTQTPLTTAQVTLVNTAIAEYGPPPVGDLQVIRQPPTQPPPVTKVTVPRLIDLPYDRVGSALAPYGLTFSGGQPLKHGSTRFVITQDPKPGTVVPRGTDVNITTQYNPSKGVPA
jgi:hypothetical protein